MNARGPSTPAAGRTVRGMLHSADLALYRAKRGGRDRVVTADVVMANAGG